MDLRRSELAGTGLDAKLATAARQIVESKIDKLAVNGDERFGIKWLCNHDNITPHQLSKWLDDKGKAVRQHEQMLGDINLLVSTIAQDQQHLVARKTFRLSRANTIFGA